MRVKLIDDCSYHTQKSHMAKDKSDTHIYPCVHNVGVDNLPTKYYWSSIKKGHFGIAKVIFGKFSNGVFIDHNDTALTQNCTAIIDSPDNLDNIAKALQHPDMMEVMEAVDFGGITTIYNKRVIKLFKHDFYKLFL